MPDSTDYVLGQSSDAARRLELQDRHFAVPSEQLLDGLDLRPVDRVVELGCGPGTFTHRILRRLGPGGVVVGVDSAPGLLEQAKARLEGAGPARFEPVQADISQLGPWLVGADVVTGRAVLHHVPMAEFLLGRLRAAVRPGTRVGFMEPDFRTPLARVGYLEATGRPELAPLRVWATAINELYLARRISPAVGATLAAAAEAAGYSAVKAIFTTFPSDALVIENMLMFYMEVRDVLRELGILTAAEIDQQIHLLRGLPLGDLPAVWGVHVVTCRA
jgi:ubiquinone/menaquinone biosynthesis C-methylase UbiE